MNITLQKSLEDRGYTAEVFEEGLVTVLRRKSEELLFIDSYTPLVPYNIGLVLSNKSFVRAVLSDAGVPVPEGKTFGQGDVHLAMVYAQELGFPLVLRQENSQKNIRSRYPVDDLQQLRKSYTDLALSEESIIVEKYLSGGVLQVYYDDAGFLNILEPRTGSAFAAVFSRAAVTSRYRQDLTVYADVTETYAKTIRPLAKKILSAFPPMPYICFSVVSDGTVLEVYHSPNKHLGSTARKGKAAIKVLDSIVSRLTDSRKHTI